ncbi:MAG: hypothetical protein FVQ83_01655 [Chloroflexi bacterium]|nr:hypothetical protein [Chloroflexota bacterium]
MLIKLKPPVSLSVILGIAALACSTVTPTSEPLPSGLRGIGNQTAEKLSFIVKVEEVQPVKDPDQTAFIIQPRLSPGEHPDIDPGPPGISPTDRDRPSLSGTPQTLDTDHFRIHYTTTGRDAVSRTDLNNNQHPDYVEEVAKAMEYTWFAEIEHFGWAPPPPDGTLGGDERYDVYLENIMPDGTAGYTEGGYSGTFVGDNPNTSMTELNSASSYISLDNDYDELGLSRNAGYTTIEYMRSTAAHEFAHAIQFGLDSDEPLEWLWEATATWIQDEVYNEVNDGNEFLEAVFKAPDSCQLTEGGSDRVEDDGHWYGLWIFLRFISENYGHQVVLMLWEKAISESGYDIFDATLEPTGLNFEDVFRAYSVALLTRDFDEGLDYPPIRLEGIAELGVTFNPVDGVAQLGVDYIEIQANGDITINLTTESLEGLLVGILDNQSHIFNMPDNQISIDASRFDKLYLLVLNQNRVGNERRCQFEGYSILVNQGGQPQSPIQIIPAPNFLSPRVEGLLNPDDYWED